MHVQAEERLEAGHLDEGIDTIHKCLQFPKGVNSDYLGKHNYILTIWNKTYQTLGNHVSDGLHNDVAAVSGESEKFQFIHMKDNTFTKRWS